MRSDTVTQPTGAMWDAMHKAPVGDDVFGEDPGMNALEERVAGMFGMEAGVFVPSGTMGNQIGLKVHTQPADEVIIDADAHIFNSEGAAGGLISGVQLRPLHGTRGILNADLVASAIRSRNDWDPRTRVVALENTANMGGGTCYSLESIRQIYHITREHDLALHMDGARIWNAAIATGVNLKEFGRYCDTISVCFSKGLGAPVGSMIIGDNSVMKKARRYRKLLGGGMRQAGMLAAAANHALDEHFERLKEDHRRACKLAEVLAESTSFEINPDHVDTNILLFKVSNGNTEQVLKWFSDQGIAMIPFGPGVIRATFHLHITDEDLQKVINAARSYNNS